MHRNLLRLAVSVALIVVLPTPLPSAQSSPLPTFRERDIDREYRHLLDQLAEGTSRGVVALRLKRLEDACYDNGWQNRLWKAQWEVTEKIEHLCGPDCLVPILYLHQDLILEYLDESPLTSEDLPRRARFALGQLEKFEALHAEQDKTAEGARTRADFSAAFGLAYRDRAMVDNARMRFQQALQEVAEHREALHMLGSLEEKLGLYRAARPPLERLVQIDPMDAVAQLRLALVDARTGMDREAEARFATLHEAPRGGPPADWIRRLAYQERAVLVAARGDWPEARRLLQQGLEEYPRDQPMVFALAYYTEDRAASREILEEFAAGSRPRGSESARGRYNNWPTEVVMDLPRRIRATVEQTRPRLAQGLVAIRGPGRLP